MECSDFTVGTSISNRDNREKSSFLGFLSSEDFQKYTPCMSTVGNAKSNCVGLSENILPIGKGGIHALKNSCVATKKRKQPMIHSYTLPTTV